MINLRLKKQMFEVVDNQILTNDPPCTKRTFIKLQEKGYSKQEAKEMIAAIVQEDIYYILKDGAKFDEQEYEMKLKRLVEEDYELELALAEEQDEILQAKNDVYDLLFEGKTTLAMQRFMSIWDSMKQWIIDEYYIADTNGTIIKPEILDIDDKLEFRYELFNWLQDIEMELHNTRMYQERLRFCKDVIDLFAWKKDSPDNYRTAIGETLNELQLYQECNDWFDTWLNKEPDNPNCINIYLYCLIKRGDLDKAKSIVDQYVTKNMPCTNDYELVYQRALSVYQTLGDEEKVVEYQSKLNECQMNFNKAILKYTSEDNKPYSFREPVVKDKKVYPNEPCPCGSGKKHKKCCGRN